MHPICQVNDFTTVKEKKNSCPNEGNRGEGWTWTGCVEILLFAYEATQGLLFKIKAFSLDFRWLHLLGSILEPLPLL